ncbi:hypothetical protein HPB49_000896 [Dermacentor silvarum]|uniref:Uncharacterized protein n=1 Tax=Dermacentor silvarum TaxID=543639 RepID=A0ACB8DM26_DERSI|nr:hypothetical protein HPB49_000896 [Dermacentor silvarum]
MSRSLPVTVAVSSDAEAGAMGTPNPFDNKVIRMGFIRKVYAILSLQLIVTSVIISIFILIPELTEFAKSPKGQILIGATSILSMIIILVLVCCQNIARSHPTNMILLSVFTVLTGVSLAGTCVKYSLSPEDYIMAVLSLYLDAINLFLFILRITRGSRS